MPDFVLIFALAHTNHWTRFECKAFGADGTPVDNAKARPAPAVVVLRDGIHYRRIAELPALPPHTTAHVIEHAAPDPDLKAAIEAQGIAYTRLGNFNHQDGNMVLANLVSLIGREASDLSRQYAVNYFVNRKDAAVRLRLISIFSELHTRLLFEPGSPDIQAKITQLVADFPMIAAMQARIATGESLPAVTDAFRNGPIEAGHP